ncbi:MAG TPA: NUDIX domain-containing protein [Caulobacteraceae bacterium]|nr:NUDIX domain-containing protein [Caulobacteraceae bacterium]
MAEDTPILPAATILLVRDQPAFEVLMVRRHHQIDFAAGALVFPGGKIDPGDHVAAWADFLFDWAGPADEARALRIAAIREAYEETGILLARSPEGAPFAGDDRAAAARPEVTADPRAFLDLVRELDIRLDLAGLAVFARWITPALMPKRFDTWFFVAAAPERQLALCDGFETVEAEWIEPAEAIRLADLGERKVIFPTRMNLKLLAEAAGAEDAMERARARRLVTVEPRIAERPEGRVLVIPADAGYGDVFEPISRIA